MYYHCDHCNALAPREHYHEHAEAMDRATPVPAPRTGKRSTYVRLRPNWRGIIGTALLSALVTGVGMAALYTVTEPAPVDTIPQCATSEDTNCYYSGDAELPPYVDVDGTAYYAPVKDGCFSFLYDTLRGVDPKADEAFATYCAQ